jgi:hypothetical protein
MPQVCVGDSAYISAAQSASLVVLGRGVAELAISVALATWRRNVAKQINDMKEEIANRQIALAEAAHGHAASFYPAEAALVAEAMAIPKTTPDYALAPGWTQFGAEANSYGRDSWLKASRALCMPPSACDDGRWSAMMRRNEVDIGNFAMRQAENRSQALNDVRFKRQLDVLALGQGKFGSGAGYSQAAGAIATNVGNAIIDTVNSAAGLVGFALKRNTVRPQWEYGYSPQIAQNQATHTVREDRNVLSGGPLQTRFDFVNDWLENQSFKQTYTNAVIESKPLPDLVDKPRRYSGAMGYE